MADFEAIKAVLQGPVAELILATWRLKAADHVSTGGYLAYLTPEQAIIYPAPQGDLSLAVVNHAPHARVLEEGHPGFHLADAIDWPTPKSKVTKDGRFYLTIPFRHYTPGSAAGGTSTHRARHEMAPEVYRVARMLAGKATGLSNVVARKRLAGFDFRVTRHYGLMAEQIGAAFPQHLRAARGYTWKAPKYAGMVRAEQQGAGGFTSGTYMTFRTLTSDSTGWYIPPQAGHHFAAETAREVAPEVTRLVAEAAKEEIAAQLEVVFGQ